jgi:DNA-binding response OmpR family regulator
MRVGTAQYLNHGVYSTRAAMVVNDVATLLIEWQPHLAIIDMDLDSAQLMALLRATPVGGKRLSVIGLTRRGDLKTKLAAFESGVDYVVESNVVDRQIRNLRARLQDDRREPRFIATVPGRGYRFLPTVSEIETEGETS